VNTIKPSTPYIGEIHTFPIPVIATLQKTKRLASSCPKSGQNYPRSDRGFANPFQDPESGPDAGSAKLSCNRSYHFYYRSHSASSVRSAQEDYTSRKGEDLRKMRVGIHNLIRIMECLQGNLLAWEFDR